MLMRPLAAECGKSCRFAEKYAKICTNMQDFFTEVLDFFLLPCYNTEKVKDKTAEEEIMRRIAKAVAPVFSLPSPCMCGLLGKEAYLLIGFL